jgi:hypothetical protein
MNTAIYANIIYTYKMGSVNSTSTSASAYDLVYACEFKKTECALKIIDDNMKKISDFNNVQLNDNDINEEEIFLLDDSNKKNGLINRKNNVYEMTQKKNNSFMSKNNKQIDKAKQINKAKQIFKMIYSRETPLTWACKNRMEEVALKLIETGESYPEHFGYHHRTALFHACDNKMKEVALKLIETGRSNPGRVESFHSDTALISACKNGMEEVALKLIETGQSEPEHINYFSKTALIYARSNKMKKVVFKLYEITFFADLNLQFTSLTLENIALNDSDVIRVLSNSRTTP